MGVKEIADVIKTEIVESPRFPYRNGILKGSFIDKNSDIESANSYSFTILSSPTVQYGKILEKRASICYRTKNHFIRHKNKHFRYIEKIIDDNVVGKIENMFNLKRVYNEND